LTIEDIMKEQIFNHFIRPKTITSVVTTNRSCELCYNRVWLKYTGYRYPYQWSEQDPSYMVHHWLNSYFAVLYFLSSDNLFSHSILCVGSTIYTSTITGILLSISSTTCAFFAYILTPKNLNPKHGFVIFASKILANKACVKCWWIWHKPSILTHNLYVVIHLSLLFKLDKWNYLGICTRDSSSQFHQRYMRAFFVRIFQQSQIVTRKTTFVRNICTYNVDEIDTRTPVHYHCCYIDEKNVHIFSEFEYIYIKTRVDWLKKCSAIEVCWCDKLQASKRKKKQSCSTQWSSFIFGCPLSKQ
jgi:hypothetical protein